MSRRPPLRGKDFRIVSDSGGRARRDGVSVTAAPGPGRLGLTVPSSAGGAVTRNRIKRRLRAALARCGASSDVDISIRGDRVVAQMDFQILVDDVCGALAQAMARMPA
jgi:ribonuclease P protein component